MLVPQLAEQHRIKKPNKATARPNARNEANKMNNDCSCELPFILFNHCIVLFDSKLV